MIGFLLSLVVAHPPMGQRSCEACHPTQAESYAPSAHARAFSNPLFQLSWKHGQERAWCPTCHDPLGGQRGMTCDTCHYDLTQKVTDDVCGHCHQFHAPEERHANVAMQDTVGEWRRSGSTKTCVECHFPKAAHRTRGGHDLPLLQQTLSVSWSGRCAVVEAKGAGHAVPTGDPFHFLRLSLCRDAACSKRLASQSLVRRMKEGPDGKLVAESDTRPQPTQRLCFEPTRATHWVLELRHAEYLVDDQAPEDERWKVIHTGALPKP